MAENKEPSKANKNDKNLKSKFNTNWFFFILLLAFIVIQVLFSGKYSKKASQREIEEMIIGHDIEKVVVVNKEQAEIYIKPEALKEEKYSDFAKQKGFGIQPPRPQYYHSFGTVELFEEFFASMQEKAGYTQEEWIHPEYQTRKDYLSTFLGVILPFLLIALVWIYFMRRMSGGAGGGGAGNIFSVGKSKAQIFDKDTHIKTNFSDVAGLEEAKTEVMEIVDFLKNPKKYTSLGRQDTQGCLAGRPSRNRKDASGQGCRR